VAAAPGGQVVDTTLNLQRAATQVVKKIDSWVLTAAQMLPNLLVAIIVLVLFWLAAMVAGRLVKRMVLRFSPYSHVARLIADISRLAVIAIGIILALSAMSLDRAVASMLAGVGIVSLAIGFASKDIASDYLAGLMIHFTHPYRTGDLIESANFFGYVDLLQLRVTICRTQQGQRVIIPNSKIISDELINFTTLGMRRVDLSIAIDWAEDLARVESLGIQAVESLQEPWRNPERQVEFFYEKFDGTNMNFSLRFWTRPEQQTYLKAASEALKAISRVFKENHVGMPSSAISLDFGGVHSLRDQLEGLQIPLSLPNKKSAAGDQPASSEKTVENEERKALLEAASTPQADPGEKIS
jgi:small conductance mechanosensitive channel